MAKATISRMSITGREPTACMPELHLHFAQNAPHWQVYGSGHARMDFRASTRNGWVSIDAEEYAEKSSKRTMITLERDAAVALRDFLNEVLGE